MWTQKENPMPAMLNNRRALAAVLIGGLLAIPSGVTFAQMGNMPMTKEAPKAAPGAAKSASGTGTIIALNAAGRKVTFDHGPMPEIEWPAMKMEFPVASSVDLTKVKTGDKVRFTLSGSGKDYTVQSISRQ
jgi:Cu/Ag efflux protein CusF